MQFHHNISNYDYLLTKNYNKIIFHFKNYNFKCGRVTHGNNKTFDLAHFDNTVSAEKARIELNGTSLLPKYSHTGIKKPIRLCRWEPKQVISERNEDDYKKSLLIKNPK